MISIVIPAHNEAAALPRTLTALHTAARACEIPYELIVADDASEDDTAAIARHFGAQVVSVNHRQIAATRNAGARAARYDWLVFVDADTHVIPALLQMAVATLEAGAVGGGAEVRFNASVPISARIGLWCWNFISRTMSWAAGCFLFVRRDAFVNVGGFDETYYASEELQLSKAIKRKGRFVILPQPAITSARKFHIYSIGSYLKIVLLTLLTAGAILRSRTALHQWYHNQRPPSES